MRMRVSQWIDEHPVRASALASWFQQCASIFAAVVLIPFILKKFSSEESGLWFSFQSWITIIGLSSFGIGFAISRQVAFTHSLKEGVLGKINGDELFETKPGWDGIRDIASSAQYLFRNALWVASALFFIIYLVAQNIGNKAGVNGWNSFFIWAGLGTSIILLLSSQRYFSIIDGLGKIYISKTIVGCGQLLIALAQLAILLLYPSLVLLSAATFLCSFAQLFASRIAVSKVSRGSLDHLPERDPEITRKLWKASRTMGIMTLSGYCVSSIQIPMISLIFGPAAVSPYYLAQRIGQVVFTSISHITLPNLPRFTNELGIGLLVEARYRMIRNIMLVSGLACLGSLFMYFLSPLLVRVWVGEGRYVDATMLAVIAVDYFVLSVTGVWGYYVLASGKNPFMWTTILHGVFTVTFIGLMGAKWGVIGVAVSTLIAGLFSNYVYNFYKGLELLLFLNKGMKKHEVA